MLARHAISNRLHSFPEANTTWDADLRSSDTHQRIVRYQLGHLGIVIRFEADGYLVEEVLAKKTHSSAITRKVGEDLLISALAENIISADTPKISDNLKVIRGQGSVPQSVIFDLKTRSIKKKKHDTTVSDQLPRLWIRQIPFLVLAYHDSGLFRSEEVMVRNVKADVAKWESEKKTDLRKLIDLIKKIADVVKATPGRKLEVLYRYGTGRHILLSIHYQFAVLSLFAPLIKLQLLGSTFRPHEICIQATETIKALLASYRRLYSLRRTPSFPPIITLASHLFHTLQEDSLAAAILNQLDQGVDDLQEMGYSHMAAVRGAQVLVALRAYMPTSPAEEGPLTGNIEDICKHICVAMEVFGLERERCCFAGQSFGLNSLFAPFPFQVLPALEFETELHLAGFGLIEEADSTE